MVVRTCNVSLTEYACPALVVVLPENAKVLAVFVFLHIVAVTHKTVITFIVVQTDVEKYAVARVVRSVLALPVPESV
jgi:hypothetical protein